MTTFNDNLFVTITELDDGSYSLSGMDRAEVNLSKGLEFYKQLPTLDSMEDDYNSVVLFIIRNCDQAEIYTTKGPINVVFHNLDGVKQKIIDVCSS